MFKDNGALKEICTDCGAEWDYYCEAPHCIATLPRPIAACVLWSKITGTFDVCEYFKKKLTTHFQKVTTTDEGCPRINTCSKVAAILDKDMLPFQYQEAIRDVCGKCDASGR